MDEEGAYILFKEGELCFQTVVSFIHSSPLMHSPRALFFLIHFFNRRQHQPALITPHSQTWNLSYPQ
jgi:hypothetical protein